MQDDYWPAPDTWLAQYRPYVVKNGILLIPVKGVCFTALVMRSVPMPLAIPT